MRRHSHARQVFIRAHSQLPPHARPLSVDCAALPPQFPGDLLDRQAGLQETQHFLFARRQEGHIVSSAGRAFGVDDMSRSLRRGSQPVPAVAEDGFFQGELKLLAIKIPRGEVVLHTNGQQRVPVIDIKRLVDDDQGRRGSGEPRAERGEFGRRAVSGAQRTERGGSRAEGGERRAESNDLGSGVCVLRPSADGGAGACVGRCHGTRNSGADGT